MAAARVVVGHPRLWAAALRQARALVPRRWWARRPYLPLPDRSWLEFRMTTAYGDPAAAVVGDDLSTWLRWTDEVRPRDPGHRIRPGGTPKRPDPAGPPRASLV